MVAFPVLFLNNLQFPHSASGAPFQRTPSSVVARSLRRPRARFLAQRPPSRRGVTARPDRTLMREKHLADRRADALRETKFPPTFANLSSVIIHAHSHPSPLHHPRIPTLTPPFPPLKPFAPRVDPRALASTPSRLASPSARPPSPTIPPRASPRASELSTPSRVLARVQSSPSVRPPRVSRPASFARASHLSHPRALARVDRRATRRGTRTTVAPRAIVATVAIVVVLARVDVCARAAPTARRPRAETTPGDVRARSVVCANGRKCACVSGKKVKTCLDHALGRFVRSVVTLNAMYVFYFSIAHRERVNLETQPTARARRRRARWCRGRWRR